MTGKQTNPNEREEKRNKNDGVGRCMQCNAMQCNAIQYRLLCKLFSTFNSFNSFFPCSDAFSFSFFFSPHSNCHYFSSMHSLGVEWKICRFNMHHLLRTYFRECHHLNLTLIAFMVNNWMESHYGFKSISVYHQLYYASCCWSC